MKKFEVSYNARNVAIKEAYFGNKVIIKNPNPGAKENAASMARNQELEQRNQVLYRLFSKLIIEIGEMILKFLCIDF